MPANNPFAYLQQPAPLDLTLTGGQTSPFLGGQQQQQAAQPGNPMAMFSLLQGLAGGQKQQPPGGLLHSRGTPAKSLGEILFERST